MVGKVINRKIANSYGIEKQMNTRQIKSIVRFMREMGASSFKIGDLSVSFSEMLMETPPMGPHAPIAKRPDDVFAEYDRSMEKWLEDGSNEERN